MRVPERDEVGVGAFEAFPGGLSEGAVGGRVGRTVGAEPAGEPAGEAVAGVAGQAHAVKAGYERSSEERAEAMREPVGEGRGAAVTVAVGNIQGPPVAS